MEADIRRFLVASSDQNLADDRFKAARQRLDFYHAVQHRAAVGRALFGEDKDQLQNWLRPLVQPLKN